MNEKPEVIHFRTNICFSYAELNKYQQSKMVDLQYICPFNSLLIELRSILGGTSALLKRAWHCFNGLYTPFGSPVIGGQKRFAREFPFHSVS